MLVTGDENFCRLKTSINLHLCIENSVLVEPVLFLFFLEQPDAFVVSSSFPYQPKQALKNMRIRENGCDNIKNFVAMLF